jgi:hypothetical protein
MAKAPLEIVRERFGSKEKLVEAVRALMKPELATDNVNPSKGLEHVSNQRLLRLHDTLSAVKKDHGSRDKLIEAIATAGGFAKDADRKAKLATYPTPRLRDLHDVAKKRAS